MSEEQPGVSEFKLPPNLEDYFTPAPTEVVDWALWMLGTEAGFIRDYVESTATAFDAAFDVFDAKVAEAASKLPEDCRAALYEDESQRAFNLKRDFPALSWLTTFVSIYSFLEDEMLGLAETLGQQIGIKLKPDDLRHSGIFAAKVYLTELCGIAFPTSKRPWQEIQHYNRIRNAIVHRRGNLFRSKHAKQIDAYIKGKTTITDEGNRLKLSKEFCLEVIENVEVLLRELLGLARARILAHEAAKAGNAMS